MFQFLIGRLKSFGVLPTDDTVTMFQFLIGRLKSNRKRPEYHV